MRGVLYEFQHTSNLTNLTLTTLVSSPGCSHGELLPSLCVRPSLTFHSKIFSSESTGPIKTKLGHNGPWVVPFQNYVRQVRVQSKIYRLKCEFYRAVRKRKGHIFFEWNKCLWIKVWKIENKKSVNVTLIRFRTTNETKSTKQINVYIKMYISVRINRQQKSWVYYRLRISNIIKKQEK